MIKRSTEDWLSLFKQQESSGLSQAQFCKEHTMCPKYFSLRKKQLKETPEAVVFVKAKRMNPSPVITQDIRLYYHGVELLLPSSSPQFVAEVVKGLL